MIAPATNPRSARRDHSRNAVRAAAAPLDVKVAAGKLEEARINIQPRIGASTYEISNQAIETQPGGANNTLSQILLQAPGVTQDSTSQGGVHVRNEHANLQYRINGVVLPEGVSLFTQNGGLSPRLARSFDLITGALPAEYGLDGQSSTTYRHDIHRTESGELYLWSHNPQSPTSGQLLFGKPDGRGSWLSAVPIAITSTKLLPIS